MNRSCLKRNKVKHNNETKQNRNSNWLALDDFICLDHLFQQLPYLRTSNSVSNRLTFGWMNLFYPHERPWVLAGKSARSVYNEKLFISRPRPVIGSLWGEIPSRYSRLTINFKLAWLIWWTIDQIGLYPGTNLHNLVNNRSDRQTS